MWKETSNEVYAVIFAKHKNDLKPHASFTDMSGNGYHFSSGHPEVMTEWGFENAEKPLQWKGLNLLGFALMEVRKQL